MRRRERTGLQTMDETLLRPTEWSARRWTILSTLVVGLVVVATGFSSLAGEVGDDVSVRWPDQLPHRASGELAVRIADRDDAPVSDANVELHYVSLDRDDSTSGRDPVVEALAEGRSDRLATSTSDDSGFATISLPPASEYLESSASGSSEESDSDETGSGNPSRVGLAIWVQPSRSGPVEQVTFEPPKRVDLAVTTDRPLYEPGQTLLLRATGVAPISGAPVEAPVEWEIRGPRDNLVFREKGALGSFGIDSTRFELAERAPSGSYTITAEAAGRTVERSVDVRHFRLPRFDVDVETDDDRARAGEVLSGEVRARYTWGAPVADAEVDVDLTAPGPGNLRIRERTSGETDSEGRYEFEWEVPHDMNAGSSGDAVDIRAVISTEAGRKGESAAQVPLRSGGFRVAVLPAPHTAPAQFVVALRDAGGQPVSDASVTVHIPERQGERDANFTTGDRGIGTFQWESPGGSSTLRLTIDPPDRDSFRRTVEVSGTDLQDLSVSRHAVTAGDTVDFRVDTNRRGATVLLVKRGVILESTYVEHVEGSTSSGTMPVPAEARGLAYVVAFREGGYEVGGTPLWVRQRTGESVSVETGRDEYRPGQQAEIALSYPATPDPTGPRGDRPPVAFGLFGVDEALYALEERTDLPLPRLLHESEKAAEAAARAAATLEDVDRSSGDTEDVERLASARFYEALGEHTSRPRTGRGGLDVTDDVTAAIWRPAYSVFSSLLGLAALALLCLAGRMPLEQLLEEDVDWKPVVRAVLLAGGGLVAFVVVAAIFAGLSGSGAIFGGATVWTLTILGFVVDAIRRHGDLRLGVWLGLVGIGGVVGFAAAVPWLYHGHAAPTQVSLFQVLGVLGALSLSVQVAGWIVLLQRRSHWSGTAGLITVFWLTVAAALSVALANCAELDQPLTGGDGAGNERKQQALNEKASAGGEAGENGSNSGGGTDRVREYFPETMVWEPEVLSDAKGRAGISVKVPDSITTWRLTAMAQTRDGRFAESNHPLVVRKPLFANVELPEHATAGDNFDVPVTVSNEATGEDAEGGAVRLEVSGAAEGALELDAGGSSARAVSVEPGEREVVEIGVAASESGAGALTIRVQPRDDGLEGDAVRRRIEVRPDGRNRTASRSGIIGETWSADLPVPAEAIPGSLAVDTSISGSPVVDALEGLEAMLAEPTGCFEQVSSTNYPNVMVLRQLDETAPTNWMGGEEKWREAKRRAEQFVSLGYQKMLSFRTDEGGFRLYPSETYEPSVMLTAYGLMQLGAMDEVMDVDLGPVMRETADWLTTRQNPSGTWPTYASGLAGGGFHGEDVGQVRSTAFVAWALLQAPERGADSATISRALDHVEQAVPDVSDANALAVAANVLVAAERQRAAEPLLNRLASSAERDEKGAYWSPSHSTWIGGSGRYADIETTALAAHALSRAETEGALLGETLRYLAEQRSPQGGWGTTQSTVWALRAFERMREASSEGPVDLDIYADGRPMARASGDGERGQLRLRPDDPRRIPFEATPERAGSVPVRVEASSSTNAMIRTTARYAVPWTSPRATRANAPFELSLEVGAREAATQEAVRATAVVENRTETAHGTTIVELPLPPGGWTARQQFEDLKGGGTVDHYEILPTHVRLYLPGVRPRERLEFSWTFTPAMEGDYSLPPVRAYPFYVPRPRAEIDGENLEVRDDSPRGR